MNLSNYIIHFFVFIGISHQENSLRMAMFRKASNKITEKSPELSASTSANLQQAGFWCF